MLQLPQRLAPPPHLLATMQKTTPFWQMQKSRRLDLPQRLNLLLSLVLKTNLPSQCEEQDAESIPKENHLLRMQNILKTTWISATPINVSYIAN